MADAQDEAPDKRTPEQISKYWQEQLDLAEKDTKDFCDNGKKVVARYKGGREGLKSVRVKKLNILYSNTEVLRAALYGKSAKPDVRRRFGMEDDAAGQVAEILEKALVYCAESYDSDKPIELGLLDYLLPGRGVVRIEYEPTVNQDPSTGQQFITDQAVYEKYVYWEDFLTMPARTWQDVLDNGWVSFRHKMTRADCVQNFGEDIGNEVPLNWMPDLANKKDTPDSLKKAEVYEIWDVTDRKRYWIVKGYKGVCRTDNDPYGLEQFFPLPEPPAFYVTTDTIVPEPEFHVYQDQADDLDEIIGRISRLTRALKRRGVYDQSVKELSRLANAGDNQFIPVENYAALSTKGGLAAAFQSEDISIIANVLIQLYQQRDMLVQAIWEQVGIADIMRGQSNASETLGAQQLKAQFGSQRLKRRQRTVQKWVRDLLKLKAEIIAEHFEPQVLQQITGQQIAPEVMQILRTDKLRSYRIDIETDSTVFEDAEQEKKSRSELIQAVTSFIQGWGPVVMQSPPLAPVAFELLKFGLGGFKSTRAVEDAIEQAAGVFEQQAQQAQQQGPKPDPEQQKIQMQAQIEQQKMQADAQKHAAELGMKSKLEAAKLRATMTADRLKARVELQKSKIELAKAEKELQIKQREYELKEAETAAKLQLEAKAVNDKSQLERDALTSQEKESERQADLKHRELDAKGAPPRKVKPEAPKKPLKIRVNRGADGKMESLEEA